MKNTSRGFAHILLILVVLLGVGAFGYYMYTNRSTPSNSNALSTLHTPTGTEDKTANWKTYTNSQYTIRYPSDWKQEINVVGNITIYNPATITQKLNNGSGTYPYHSEFVTISPADTNQTAKQFVDNLVQADPAYTSLDKTKIDRTTVTIDGQPAEMINAEGEGSSGYDIYVTKGTIFIDISTSTNSLKNESTEAQIISTFKFN